LKRRRGTYLELRLLPMTLMKMVVEGKATIVGKDKHGRRIYKLR